ncbi:AFR154Cp [Eremothecium gossypii ATCC 10895]|uniref:AFR154Cp n=1 Tax=Eremothecium gossypii (strain ATCC 10895 / CBS 109.51 / FGSC 9923 / NRRL Y-1056) TaxID=284811 RepID=Q754B6_EREGS|nr:AFR154Cp [Eremothecium gossypii ATCC 10895]AAS53525.1 AFR154Cp [Eremothecium gossypii ATCC 10895]
MIILGALSGAGRGAIRTITATVGPDSHKEARDHGYGRTMSDSLFSSCDNISLTDSVFDHRSLTYFSNDEQRQLKLQIMQSCGASDQWEGRQKNLQLGVSRNGFVSHSLRRHFWHCILRGRVRVCPRAGVSEHPDEHQMELDVRRSFGFVENEGQKQKLRELLQATLVRFFRKYPSLRYYQGYHDVVSVILMVYYDALESDQFSTLQGSADDLLSSSVASSMSEATVLPDESTQSTVDTMFEVVEMFSLLYLRDFMMDSLDFTIDQLQVIPQLIKIRDVELFRQLHLDQVSPFFALSSILTIFSHDLKPCKNQLSPLYQIFDLVITSGNMMAPLVIYMELIVEHKEDLLRECDAQSDLFENITDLVHGAMQQVMQREQTTEQWQDVLERGRLFLEDHPLAATSSEVRKFRWLNPYSVLKENPGDGANYSLSELLDIVEREIAENERRKSMALASDALRNRIKNIRRICRSLVYFGSLWRWPIYIGIFALLIRVYSANFRELRPINIWYVLSSVLSGDSPITGIPFSFRLPGVGTKTWFLDPLRSLLPSSAR